MSSVAKLRNGEATSEERKAPLSAGEPSESHPQFDEVVVALVGALDAAVSESVKPAADHAGADRATRRSEGASPEGGRSLSQRNAGANADLRTSGSAVAHGGAPKLPKATPFDVDVASQRSGRPTSTAASVAPQTPSGVVDKVSKRKPVDRKAASSSVAASSNGLLQSKSATSARAAFERLVGVVKRKSSKDGLASDGLESSGVKSPSIASTTSSGSVGRADEAAASSTTYSAAPVPSRDVSLEAALQELGEQTKRTQRRRIALLSSVSLAWLGSLVFGAYQIAGFDVVARPLGLDEISSGVTLALLPIGVFALVMNAVAGRGARSAERGLDMETIDPAPLKLLSASMRSEIQAMTASLQTVIARSSDLETLIRSEIKALEGAYFENETRMRGIVSELASQRESIVSHVEKVRKETQQLSETFAGSSHTATVSLKAVQDDLLKSLIETCASIEGRLTGSKELLQEGVHQAVDAARVRLDEETKQLISSFTQRSHELAALVSRAGAEHLEALTSNTQNLGDALARNVIENKKTLEEGGRELSQSISRASSHARDALSQTGQSVELAIQQRVKATSDVLSLAANEIIEIISERSDKTEKLLKEEIDIEKRLSEQLARLQEINQALNGSGGSIASSILESATKAQSEISACGQAVAVTIANRSKAINEAISRSGEELAGAIVARGEAVERNLEEKIGRLEAINESIKRAGRELSTSLAKSVAQVQNDLASSGKALTASLEQSGMQVSKTFAESGSKAERALAEYADTLNERINSLEAVGSSLKSAGFELSEGLVADLAKLKDEITIAGRFVVNAVSERSNTANETIAASSDQLVSALSDYTEQFEVRVNDRIDKLDTLMSSRTGQFERAFNARLERLHGLIDTLDGTGVEVGDSVIEAVSRLREEMVRLSNDVSETLVDRGRAVSSTLAATMQTADEVFTEHQGQINSVLGERLEQLDGLMGQRTEVIEAALSSSSKTLSLMNERLGDVFDERIEQLEQLVSDRASLLSERLVELNNLMADRLDEELRAVSERADSLNDVLSARAESFAALIESDDELARRVAERIEEAAAALRGAADTTEEASQQSERSLMERAARLVELNQLISERLDRDASDLEVKVDKVNAITEAQAEAFARLIEHDAELAERLMIRLRSASEQFDEAGRVASEKLSTVEDDLSRKAAEITKVVESIAEDARSLAEEVAARRSESEAEASKVAGRRSTSPSFKAKTTKGSKVDAAPSGQVRPPSGAANKRDGWISDLLKRASDDDGSLVVDSASRRRSSTTSAAIDARGVISSLSTNIDYVISSHEAFEYWAEISLESVPLRRIVGDFGQRVYKYLDEAQGNTAVKRDLRSYARSFETKVMSLLATRGEQALLEFLVSVDGRVGTVVADAMGILPGILDSLAAVENGSAPHSEFGKRI